MDNNQPSVNNLLFDFENSPLRFEYELLLAEYQKLREEITARLSSQQQIINFAVTIMAALFAISQLFPNINDNTFMKLLLPLAYPLLSIIFSSIAMLYAEQDFAVADIATYINKELRPQMQRILGIIPNVKTDILGWDKYRDRNQYGSIGSRLSYYSMAGSRYILMLLPSSVLLITRWLESTTVPMTSTLDKGIFLVAAFYQLWVLFIMWQVPRKYFGIH